MNFGRFFFFRSYGNNDYNIKQITGPVGNANLPVFEI